MEIGDGIFRQVARKFRLDADPRRIRLYRQRQYPFDGPSSRLLQAYYDIGRHEPGRRKYLVHRYVEERISVVIQHWQIVERQAYGLAGLLVVQAELIAGKRFALPPRLQHPLAFQRTSAPRGPLEEQPVARPRTRNPGVHPR